MTRPNDSSVWKKQSIHPNCEWIDCPPHDPIRDYKGEPTGVYVLIRVDQEGRSIEVALCDRDHRIFKVFRGQKSQDLYHTIFTHENPANPWFQSKAHIAYLGKELKKAELALEQGRTYLQE